MTGAIRDGKTPLVSMPGKIFTTTQKIAPFIRSNVSVCAEIVLGNSVKSWELQTVVFMRANATTARIGPKILVTRRLGIRRTARPIARHCVIQNVKSTCGIAIATPPHYESLGSYFSVL
jgi:hypothetical protein